MREKEGNFSGETYESVDPELLFRWHEAKRHLRRCGETPTGNRETLTGILENLLGSFGRKLWITNPVFVD